MSKKIQVLNDNLIDKIAAGEVIERPSSIVKELIENSIDAGAKNINIEIKNGGTNFIKILDDGQGIEKNEVKTAFLRHATSKLREFEEIGSILTLGFRGEALSSIASVSQLEMTTKSVNEKIGSKITINGGQIISHEDYPAVKGTEFIIRNIFFNTPVRKKFLKKESVESGYITDIINRFAMGNPSISFKYINNGSTILNTPGNNDLKTAIFCIYGKEIANKMLEVKNKKEGFTLSGFITSPEISRGNRSYGNLFINGRYIKSKLVQEAIEEALEGKLMIGKFPIYVINITTPENTVDVNVHPTKMEVRFSNNTFMFDFVKQSIVNTLKNNSPIPEFSYNSEKLKLSEITETKPYTINSQKDLQDAILNSDNNENSSYLGPLVVKEPTEARILDEHKNNNFNIIDEFYNKNTELPYKNNSNNSVEEILINNKVENSLKSNNIQDFSQNKTNINKIFNSYKIIGQLFNTYWILEKEDNMYMVDQHALHEKYLYEKFINSVKEEKITSQQLLNPCTINVTEIENVVIKENLELLQNFGFKFEEFGLNSYVIREVPFIFNSPMHPEFFIEVIDIISDKEVSNIYELMLDKIASISCKAAIKGNDKINVKEAEKMLDYVLNLENPFNCPHGRPTIVKFSKYEIEKMFKRIQN